MTPSTLAIIASVTLLAAYVAVGIRQYRANNTTLSYFLSGRSLDKGAIRNTFAGAAISVSTVLVFFFTIGIQFGWQILLSPVTLTLGVLLFRYLVHPNLLAKGFVQPDPDQPTRRQIDSLADVVFQLYGSRVLTATITAISALGILAILVAELMVGVTVLQVAGVDPTYALLSIALVLLLYAGLGGMRSIVATDRWQVLIVVSALTLVLVFLLSKVAAHTPQFASDFLFAGWSPAFSMPLALVVNITLVNLCLLPASLRVWQVVAASSSAEAFRRALWESTLLIIYTSLCALIIGKSMLVLLDTPNLTTDMLFEYLESAGRLSSYILYPMFVVALLSALVSTADSALLALAQSIHLLRTPRFSYSLNFCILAGLLGVAIGAYFLVTRVLNMSIVNWILTVFSITTVIAPAIIIPLFLSDRRLNRVGELVMSSGLITSCALAILWSARYSQDIATQPWNCAIGVGVSSLATIVSLSCFSLRRERSKTTNPCPERRSD